MLRSFWSYAPQVRAKSASLMALLSVVVLTKCSMCCVADTKKVEIQKTKIILIPVPVTLLKLDLNKNVLVGAVKVRVGAVVLDKI